MTEKEIRDKYLKIHDVLTASFNKGEVKIEDFKTQHDAIWAKCDIDLMDNGFLDATKTVSTSDTDNKQILHKDLLIAYYSKASAWLSTAVTNG